MASMKDSATNTAATNSEGRTFTGLPRVKLISEGSRTRVFIDYNDRTGVDPRLYPNGTMLPKGITFREWQLARQYQPLFDQMEAEFERMDAAKKKEENK